MRATTLATHMTFECSSSLRDCPICGESVSFSGLAAHIEPPHGGWHDHVGVRGAHSTYSRSPAGGRVLASRCTGRLTAHDSLQASHDLSIHPPNGRVPYHTCSTNGASRQTPTNPCRCPRHALDWFPLRSLLAGPGASQARVVEPRRLGAHRAPVWSFRSCALAGGSVARSRVVEIQDPEPWSVSCSFMNTL